MTGQEQPELKPGDVVRVRGLRGEFRVTGWREEPGGLVVNLVGGPAGHRMFRSVHAERVKQVKRARRPLVWGGGGGGHAA